MTIRIVQRLWVFTFLCPVGCGTATAEKDTPPEPLAAVKDTKAEPPAALRAVPANAVGFVHVRLADISNSAAFADVRPMLAKAGPQALEIFEKKYVPAPSTIDSLTAIYLTAGSLGESVFYGAPKRESAILAVSTTRPYGREQMVKACGAKADKFNDQTFFIVPDQRWGFHFVDDRTFVIGSEQALRRWLGRPGGDGSKGPLQAAWSEANQKHAVVVGFNVAALPRDPFGPFRSSQRTFDNVSTIGGGPVKPPPAPPPAPKPPETWSKVAVPLLQARSLTLTFDLDSKLQGQVKFDFASEDDAKTGETAARAGVQAARKALASAIEDGERELRDGPRTFAFVNQTPKKKPEGPKPLPRDIDQFSNDVFNLFQLGLYRAVDEHLKDLPVERKGTSVQLHASAPVNTSSLIFAISAITALGSNANSTFTEVGNTIEVSPKTIADPPEIQKKPIDKKTSEAPKKFDPILPPGTRAVSIRVQAGSDASGFAALPSSRVDIIASDKFERGENAFMVAENALVLAADISDKHNRTMLVTVALLPADAARVAEAQEQHRLQLHVALRRPQDEKRKEDKK